jgi:exodeoxyribonuclease-3
MKIVSWNVNGLRAIAQKGFHKSLEKMRADIICVQETKAQEHNLNHEHTSIGDYTVYLHSAEKKGYSGVAIYTLHAPLSVITGIGNTAFDSEGRVLGLEFEKFFVFSIYAPNAQPELVRITYRKQFNDALLTFMQKLEQKSGKHIILCGDFNVAHNEIDLKNPAANRGNPGFSDAEREKFNELLAGGFHDTFRTLHPITIAYSWWSYRSDARARNIGWRIDYVLIDDMHKVAEAFILPEIMGSDHCPVGIILR